MHSIPRRYVLNVDSALGLSASEVVERRTRYGSNSIQSIRPRPAWRLLFDQFTSVVIALLYAAALIAWATGDVVEALAIAVVREYYLSDGRRIEIEHDECAVVGDELLQQALRIGVLCNEAAFSTAGTETTTLGDPTETALLVGCRCVGHGCLTSAHDVFTHPW